MGNSNNDDDSCCCNNPLVNENVYFDAYKSFKETFTSIQNKNVFKLEDIYLISTKSIDNFIKIIEKLKILEKIKENTNDLKNIENNLKREFQQYQNINNIIIYDSFSPCEELAIKDDDKENEFIIANKAFIDKLSTKRINKQNVILNMNRNNSNMEIFFPTSHNKIFIIEKRIGIYKFIIKKEENNNSKNEFNPSWENDNEIMPRPDKAPS